MSPIAGEVPAQAGAGFGRPSGVDVHNQFGGVLRQAGRPVRLHGSPLRRSERPVLSPLTISCEKSRNPAYNGGYHTRARPLPPQRPHE